MAAVNSRSDAGDRLTGVTLKRAAYSATPRLPVRPHDEVAHALHALRCCGATEFAQR